MTGSDLIEQAAALELPRFDRLKSQFLATMNHDFRTPLTLMLGPIEEALLDEEERLGPIQRQRLTMLQRNGLRLQKLVDTLLDFSRIGGGRVRAHYQPTDLAALTADLAGTFRPVCERAGLTLTIETETLPEPVFVDHEMWEKIVLNLISNAVKFTFTGEIKIVIKATDRNPVLTVSDTGTGIPAAELPRLFDRFHRIAGAEGRTPEGTGIGLALVQDLVWLHKGVIEAASTLGRGSCFTVRLPWGSTHLPQDQIGGTGRGGASASRAGAFVGEALRWLPNGPEASAGPVEPGGVPQARILLAGDNADLRDYLTRLLAPLYEITAIGDGLAALSAAERLRPDLILSDVMMPGLDGMALVRHLRADPQLKLTPIILLSAGAGEEAELEGLSIGADSYLVKPFSGRELIMRAATGIALARSRRESADRLRMEDQRLKILARIAATLAAELDPDTLVQTVIDAAVELTGAQTGVFCYRPAKGEAGTPWRLAVSGALGAAFADLPPAPLQPILMGGDSIRIGDMQLDPRAGPAAASCPLASYLAVPVIAPGSDDAAGQVLGGLFLGHQRAEHFTEHHELLIAGLAAQAALGVERARLYQASRDAEAALKQLNETLERRVAEAVAQRLEAEDALRQAQKMEAIGQLTGGIAHDFNNLLQVVLGNLDTVRRHLEPGTGVAARPRRDLLRPLDGAISGAERAASLTQRLLMLSRRQPMNPRPIDVNQLLNGMSDLLRHSLGESVTIEMRLGPGPYRTLADPNQLEAAILNIAANARDAMPAGGTLGIASAIVELGTTKLGGLKGVNPGTFVVLTLTDTGCGMTKAVLEQAFEPFFTTKAPGHGTGLSLAQVYSFVRQSGGHIKLESETGRGTIVQLSLPRLAAETLPAEPGSDLAGLDRIGSETILLVEDDPAVRELSAVMLSDLGYQVLQAETGMEALSQLEAEPDIELLFTDIGLPGGVDGTELAARARTLRPGLKVLLTSGYAKNAGLCAGGAELLPKPFTAAALGQRVRQLLDQ